MVISRGEMKRKRREDCPSPILDESPKRTKVHAQRKFAQGSNVNSPVITPVKEIEKQEVDVLPEPVELLPIKRPNTEDFLTFLCFRGTPILPPSLNFFNTASIVDTNGQVHEIKSESPKNGPIDTSVITKAGAGSSERPFVAFGVRKRADPIVISKQMDKKRRHALALQALRRKYQEQRMAKIRAVTISKLSEKVTTKSLVRSNSVSKTETVTKKSSSLAKSKENIGAVKHMKVRTRSVKAALRPQIKQKMCLRSFRGRFVQRELQFRNVKKRILPMKKLGKSERKVEVEEESSEEYSSDDEKPLLKVPKAVKTIPKVVLSKIAKKSAPSPKKPTEFNFRITRSNKLLCSKMVSRRQQIKQRMLLTTPKTIILKPRTLRSQTAQKAKILPETKQKIMKMKHKRDPVVIKKPLKVTETVKKDVKKEDTKFVDNSKKESKTITNTKKGSKPLENTKEPVVVVKKEPSCSVVSKNEKVVAIKKEIENTKKVKVVAKASLKKVESVNNNTVKKDISSKNKPLILKKPTSKAAEPIAKKENVNKKEQIKENEDVIKNSTEQKENVELRTSQRPTRKTKEAAAIYMEILSHKLVNEGKIDDDNVSIDSFPELPNVKKTEQREIELKAKAKCNKTPESEAIGEGKKTVKCKEKEVELSEGKILRSHDKKIANVPNKNENITAKNMQAEDKSINKVKDNEKIASEEEKIEDIEVKKISIKEETCDRKTRQANKEKPLETLEKIKEVELKVHIKPIDVGEEPKKATEKEVNANSDTDVLLKHVQAKKPEEKIKCVDAEVKRQTRSSSQNIRHVETDDSDESFRADIVIPRKKQITRSKVPKTRENDAEESSGPTKKSLRPSSRSYKECSSGESDHSTTSNVNIKQVNTAKSKKFTKTRSQQKSDQGFSDSDEEPLSKLTLLKNVECKEVAVKEEVKEEVHEEKTIKVDAEAKVSEEVVKKPKRECAKRPQNYLPMLSSSEEEDYYCHGFKAKSESKQSKPAKPPENNCSHVVPPSMDLSCKDIGRRFGKEKVNMSTEQIEKWLKDSAMAGHSVKTENDSMLVFGETIPTETSFNVANSIDTEQLKSLLILQKQEVEKKIAPAKVVADEVATSKLKALSKSAMVDSRKLIFRNKAKVDAVRNVNAFSASNESSVYAFGEEAENVMKTPFRRPSRRPSSTATSRSEDESSKFEELPKTGSFRKPPVLRQDSSKSTKESAPTDDVSEDNAHADSEDNAFYVPSQPQKSLGSTNRVKAAIISGQKIDRKPVASTSMIPPSSVAQKSGVLKHSLKQSLREKISETPEEGKYKVPSSPSASSSSSAKLYKRQNCKLKLRTAEVLPVKLPEFPVGGPCGQLVEAPTFHPSEKEFQDPLEYIEKIRHKAEQFGICRIIPPATFKPECKVTDDMRFTAYNQYVHKMLHRWGPNFKELMAIRKYLSTQNISLTHPPWIGGMEVDLPRLYQTVQSLGGLKEVIEKKRWPKVSDAMKIPKSAQDRVTKLDDIYCKYLLPYDTLSPAEREKLFDEVETEWAKRESKSLLKAQQNIDDNSSEVQSESDDEAEECTIKGRSMALNAFYRIARNTMSMWFKNSEPLPEEVEQEFWKHVTLKQNHICVHSGSIDSGNWGYGFAVSKNSPFARHAWNLKVLTNNSGSVLRSMGPVMAVTVPTLHVGMVFSSCCWYRDPHSLPWIEYLHTGGSKIWYGIPDSTSGAFHAALKSVVPNYCRNKSIWLPSDTVMVPPSLLVEHGVSLCRIVQEPGQFIIVFPKVFTSSLSTGYVVSESVYFAPPYWLKTGRVVFNELRNSCEPSMFSFDRLLLSIVNDARSNVEVLKQIIPIVQELCDNEKAARDMIRNLGVCLSEKLPLREESKVRKKKKLQNEDGEYECEICRMNLFVSMVNESQEDGIYCLNHAAEQIEKNKIQGKHCKLMFTYDYEELDGLIDKIKTNISNKIQKKIPNKFAGMPTLLTA